MSAQHLSSKPAKPLVRVSGGTPNGFPDFVPVNPWGRPMPRPPAREKPELYQVVVRDKLKGNAEVRVGPQWAREHAETLQLAIAGQIKTGAERRWSDPVVVKIPAEMGRPVLVGG